MRFNDAVLGTVILVFGAAVAIFAEVTFPGLPGQEFGPAFFPIIIGIVLSGCGMILIVQGIKKRQTHPFVRFGEWVRMPGRVVNFVLVFVALIAYILLTDSVGFIPIVFAIMFVLMMRFGCRLWTSAVVALIATLIIHTAFYVFLHVPLPWGVLEPVQW